jgi:hypothetical protein
MYAAGFYTNSIFALLIWETRRSDFGAGFTNSAGPKNSEGTILTNLAEFAKIQLKFDWGRKFKIWLPAEFDDNLVRTNQNLV